MNKLITIVENTLQTTNGSTTTIITYSHPDVSIVDWILSVVGITSDYANYAIFNKSVSTVRNGAVVNLIGSLSDLLSPKKSLGASLWSVSASASGSNLIVQVTGAAGTTINWRAILRGENHYKP